MRVRKVAVAAAALVAGLALAGCGADIGLSKQTKHSSRSFDVDSDTLRLTVDNDVTIVPGAAGTVTVERWLTGKAAKHPTWRRDGDKLTLTAKCVGVSLNCDSRYRVAVPADLSLTLSSQYGAVTVEKLTGGLNVHADHGDVQLSAVSGPVRIATGYGDVSVRRTGSDDVLVDSDSGSIRLAFRAIPKRVTAQSTYGNVSVTVPKSSYHVTTRTKYGDVSSRLPDHAGAPRTITAETDNGDVAVRATG